MKLSMDFQWIIMVLFFTVFQNWNSHAIHGIFIAIVKCIACKYFLHFIFVHDVCMVFWTSDPSKPTLTQQSTQQSPASRNCASHYSPASGMCTYIKGIGLFFWVHVFGIKSLQHLMKSQVCQQINVLKAYHSQLLHLSFVVDLFKGLMGQHPSLP